MLLLILRHGQSNVELQKVTSKKKILGYIFYEIIHSPDLL